MEKEDVDVKEEEEMARERREGIKRGLGGQGG